MISVIIPVYNVEKYLSCCLDSVIGQTYKNIEIIVVDDGSTDDSGCICDAYAQKDNRIKVIHKTNGGLSSARNAALDIATGEYIAFVDSDDYLLLSTFEKCHNKLLETKADVCMFAYYTTNGKVQNPHKLTFEKEFYNKDEVREFIFPKFFGAKKDDALEGFVFRQIFKRNTIGDIRFRSEREYFAEDVVFDIEVYKKGLSLCVINEPLYCYRYVETSLSNRYREDLFKKLNTLFVFMNETGVGVDIYNRILDRAFKMAIFACLNVKKGKTLTKKQQVSLIKEIAGNIYVKKSISTIRRKQFKEKVFAWLLKKNAARLILALI